MGSSIGQRIADFRKKSGLSQRELADATGVSLSAISRYEGNKREPTAAVIMSLAKVLSTTGDALLGLEPQPDLVAQNSDEAHVLRTFRGFNDLGQNKVLEIISDLSELSKYTEKNSPSRLPS